MKILNFKKTIKTFLIFYYDNLILLCKYTVINKIAILLKNLKFYITVFRYLF